MALGLDFFHKETNNQQYQSYDTKTIGGAIRFGFELREDLALQLRYSIAQQEITLQDNYSACYATVPWIPGVTNAAGTSCYGERRAFAAGAPELRSGRAADLDGRLQPDLQHAGQQQEPDRPAFVPSCKQDLAGVGGDVSFIRTSGDVRMYHEIIPDYVGLLRLQGGNIAGWGGTDLRCWTCSRAARTWCAASARTASARAT